MKKNVETMVVSLGGSLIVPGEVDVSLLKNFRKSILSLLRTKKYRFIVVTGGGKITRMYQNSGKEIASLTHKDLDWMGIYSTRLNAQLVRVIFGKAASPDIVIDPMNDSLPPSFQILVSGGWKPGRSTDYVAVCLAKRFGVKRVFNLSNIEGVYDKDPRKHTDAVLQNTLSWKAFRQLSGGKWTPGMNSPFDPIASSAAERSGISVTVASGEDMKNFEHWVKQGSGRGTLIS